MIHRWMMVGKCVGRIQNVCHIVIVVVIIFSIPVAATVIWLLLIDIIIMIVVILIVFRHGGGLSRGGYFGFDTAYNGIGRIVTGRTTGIVHQVWFHNITIIDIVTLIISIHTSG